jgi:hypothetical protein
MIKRIGFTVLACSVLFGCGESVGMNPPRLTDEPYWVVRLNFSDQYVCTGIVLSEHWLLTAGHCVADAPEGPVEVSHEVFDVRSTAYRGAAERILHPDYSGASSLVTHRWHDVGLVRLSEGALDIDDRGRLCGITSTFDTLFYGREPLYAVGYGYLPLSDGGLCSTELGSKKRYDGFLFDTFKGPLVGGPRLVELEGRKDALCDGDSGSPLMFDVDGEPSVFAVFSGESFNRLTFYGTLVAPKIAWIESASAGTAAPLDCVADGNDLWECFE